MDQQALRAQVIEVLAAIQQDSDRAGGPITGSTCPAKDLRGFDSKVWPVATTMLSQATGLAIPDKTNLFVSANGKQHRSVDEIAADLSRLASDARTAA